MKYKSISKKQDESQLGKAKGESLPISFKKSVEFCRLLMGKKLSLAYKIIEDVKAMKTAVPFKRYNSSVAHKKGIGPGRFPVKTAVELEKMLKNAEKNATSKGLDVNSLEILHISADKGPTTYKPARHRGRVAKRTHIEIVLISKRSGKKDLKDIVSKSKTQSKEKIKSSSKKISDNTKNQEESAKISKTESGEPKSSEEKTIEKKTESQAQVQAQVKEDSKKEQNTKVAGSEDKADKKKQKSNSDEKNHDQKESSLDKKGQKTNNPQGAKK
jgi:large subunit ribosomal protein L22